MIKLSIIIPIYKVEKYIVECIESICCQLIDGVEVILVNDGTPDNSMLLARQYISEKYKHLEKQFLFIDQENQGLSGARNTGIRISRGEYIAFLDSDDKFSENYFDKIMSIIIEYDVDLIQFSAIRFDDMGNHFSFLQRQIFKGFIELNEQVLRSIFESSSWFAWLRVYNKKLFDFSNLFPLGINYEDAFLVPRLILKSSNIFYLDDTLVLYRLNPNGITFSNSKKNIDNCQFVLESMIDRIQEHQLYKTAAFNMVIYFIEISLFNEGYNSAKNRWHLIKMKLKNVNMYNLSLKQKSVYFLGIYYIYIKRIYHWLRR